MEDYYSSEAWNKLRSKALKRDGRKCVFCTSKENLVVHHIVPRKKGGKDELFNLITLCASCHRRDHAFIDAFGLATIPGPEWEIYRFELTNQNDVLRYAEHLDNTGLDGSYLREQENLRGL